MLVGASVTKKETCEFRTNPFNQNYAKEPPLQQTPPPKTTKDMTFTIKFVYIYIDIYIFKESTCIPTASISILE